MTPKHPTPRTDAHLREHGAWRATADFTRELERELAEAKAQIEHTGNCCDVYRMEKVRSQELAAELAEALEMMTVAMVTYEMDADGDAPAEHRLMMKRVRAALAKWKEGKPHTSPDDLLASIGEQADAPL